MNRTLLIAVGIAFAAGGALAQQYRWTDERGQVHYTDTPPPKGAKDVRKQKPPAAPGSEVVPYDLSKAQADYPVTLYTAPSCKEPCTLARGALNRRGVPFKEVQVYDDPTNEELKKLSGSNEVPVLKVGATVQKGFEQGAFDALLDSAGYPRAGLLPPRTQEAPPVPKDYVPPEAADAAKPKAEPVKPEPEAPRGPYSPGASAKPAAKPAAKSQ